MPLQIPLVLLPMYNVYPCTQNGIVDQSPIAQRLVASVLRLYVKVCDADACGQTAHRGSYITRCWLILLYSIWRGRRITNH